MTEELLRNAPVDTFDMMKELIDDLTLEAKNWLDGEPVGNEEQAQSVAALINRLRRVSKEADEARAVEKQPHWDAGKAVDAKWNVLTDSANRAVVVAREALTPWLKAEDDRIQREAEVARAEAARLAEVARQAHQSSAGNLEAREDAERLVAAAKGASRHANKASRGRARATGGERAIVLRSTWNTELTDSMAALKYYREVAPDALKAWLLEMAERDVRGGKRVIPGFTITEDKQAV